MALPTLVVKRLVARLLVLDVNVKSEVSSFSFISRKSNNNSQFAEGLRCTENRRNGVEPYLPNRNGHLCNHIKARVVYLRNATGLWQRKGTVNSRNLTNFVVLYY